MIHAIQIGPLSLPAGFLLLALATGIALWTGHLLARGAGVDVESRLYRALLAGVLCARLGFVLQHLDAYASAPWSILDIRDGGWSAWSGLLGAWIYSLVAVRRSAAMKKPLLSALALSSTVWAIGMVFLAMPPREVPTLPDFDALSLEGDRISLPAYAGKPAVINLWATWCPPCRREMPALERAQNQHPDVHIVFLNQGETPARIQQFLAENRLSLRHVLLDPQGEVARSLGHRSLPTTLFFNAEGRLADVRVGELSYPTLAQRIDALKRGKPTE